jgi:hypothetical protein
MKAELVIDCLHHQEYVRLVDYLIDLRNKEEPYNPPIDITGIDKVSFIPPMYEGVRLKIADVSSILIGRKREVNKNIRAERERVCAALDGLLNILYGDKIRRI